MIELPEANVLAKQFAHHLTGKRVRDMVAAGTPHKFTWYSGEPELYGQRFQGHTLTGARAYGGQVEVHFEDQALLFNDGPFFVLTGPGEEAPSRHQLQVAFEDGYTLTVTTRMYAGMCAYKLGEYDNGYYQVAVDKPNPLTDAFDAAYFESIRAAAKPKLTVKGLLATEQRIPGLGNGVLQDILLAAGLRPMRKLCDVSDAQAEVMFRCVKDKLHEMTALGGRDTERDLLGKPGGYHVLMNSKAMYCALCGGPVTRKAYMGGNVYYCEKCQQ